MTINREIVVERIIPTDDWSTYKDSRRLDVTNSSDVNPDAPNRGRVVFENVGKAVLPQVQQTPRGDFSQVLSDTEMWRSISRVLAVLVLLVLAGVLLFQFLVMPSSTIRITPYAEYVPIDVTVRIDPDAGSIDLVRGIVPAKVMEASVGDVLTKPTTGRRREAETTATGFVTIRNRTRKILTLPIGSRVRSAGDVGFLTDAEILIPPTLQLGGRDVPGEAIVAVTAESPGLLGNAPALSISSVDGSLGSSLDAFNPQPLQGGSEREVALVTQRDLDELHGLLFERLQSAAIERLRRERLPNEMLVVWSPAAGNPQVLDRVFSASLDERASTVALNMDIRARGTAFSTSDLKAVLSHRLKDAPSGADIKLDDIRISNWEVLGESQGVLDLRVEAVGEAVDTIDHEQVRQSAVGRSLADGMRGLDGIPGADEVVVKHYPKDTGNFPRLGFRIDVKVTAPKPNHNP